IDGRLRGRTRHAHASRRLEAAVPDATCRREAIRPGNAQRQNDSRIVEAFVVSEPGPALRLQIIGPSAGHGTIRDLTADGVAIPARFTVLYRDLTGRRRIVPINVHLGDVHDGAVVLSIDRAMDDGRAIRITVE